MKKSAFFTVIALSASPLSSHYVQAGGDEAAMTCFGMAATIIAVPGVPTAGTPEADVIIGTPFRDIISGNGGDDLICGLGGSDVLFGDSGNDTIDGDNGADVVYGGLDDDTLFGSGNRDTIIGGLGVDEANGGQGNDFCEAESTLGCEEETSPDAEDEIDID